MLVVIHSLKIYKITIFSLILYVVSFLERKISTADIGKKYLGKKGKFVFVFD
jgi:hypothetical protein